MFTLKEEQILKYMVSHSMVFKILISVDTLKVFFWAFYKDKSSLMFDISNYTQNKTKYLLIVYKSISTLGIKRYCREEMFSLKNPRFKCKIQLYMKRWREVFRWDRRKTDPLKVYCKDMLHTFHFTEHVLRLRL